MLDIQKLATEMGLNCITTYKLDALKAVCRRNENNISLGNSNGVVTIQGSESLRFNDENISSGDAERLKADATCTEKGRQVLLI